MGNGVSNHTWKKENSTEKVERFFKTHANSENFFYQVYKWTMKRSPTVQKVLDIEDIDKMDEMEMDILFSLASSLKEFFNAVITLTLEGKNGEADRLCFSTGVRHAKYSKEKFEPAYWDVFIIAMTCVLEKSQPQPLRDELHAWQEFIQTIVNEMRRGYKFGCGATAPEIIISNEESVNEDQ